MITTPLDRTSRMRVQASLQGMHVVDFQKWSQDSALRHLLYQVGRDDNSGNPHIKASQITDMVEQWCDQVGVRPDQDCVISIVIEPR